jgi:hypothetical protein
VNTEYAVANSAFLVREKLAYVPRFGLHEAIVKKFETRQAMRCKHKTSGVDKALNQLMVLTATSGAGKSTELVQFPASAAYRAYAEAAGALPLIVCLLSARDTAPPVHPLSIGVWILHGALRAMHVTAMGWGEFVRSFGQCGLSAYDAVQMLRELLRAPADAEGKLRHRKAWVCVDDIEDMEDMACGAEDGSDAEWSRCMIFRELCELLSCDGNCDVLVSTRSLGYICQCIFDIGRPMHFLPVLPLIGTVLEFDAAVKGIFRECYRLGVRTTGCKARVLRSGYLLASGHPHSLRFLIEHLSEESGRTAMVGSLCEDTSAMEFLCVLCATMRRMPGSVAAPEIQPELCLLLDTQGFGPERKQFCEALNEGRLQIFSLEHGLFRVMTPLPALLGAAASFAGADETSVPSRSRPAVAAFLFLFRPPLPETLSKLWVRSRALSTWRVCVTFVAPSRILHWWWS